MISILIFHPGFVNTDFHEPLFSPKTKISRNSQQVPGLRFLTMIPYPDPLLPQKWHPLFYLMHAFLRCQ